MARKVQVLLAVAQKIQTLFIDDIDGSEAACQPPDARRPQSRRSSPDKVAAALITLRAVR